MTPIPKANSQNLLLVIFKQENEQACIVSLKLETSRNNIPLEKRPSHPSHISPKVTRRYVHSVLYCVPTQHFPFEPQRKQGSECWPFPLEPSLTKQETAHKALTYNFCCLLEFGVPNLGSTRARQPFLPTMSGTVQEADLVWKTSRSKGGRGAYSPCTQTWHRL